MEFTARPAALSGVGGSYTARELDSVDSAVAYCEAQDLHLDHPTARGWVIRSDDDTGGIGSILGCVEERDDGFELMNVHGGFAWSIFGTLVDAIAGLVAALAARADEKDPTGLAANSPTGRLTSEPVGPPAV